MTENTKKIWDVWLTYEKENAEKNKAYIQMYLQKAATYHMNITLILIEQLDYGVENGEYILYYQGKKMTPPDLVISRCICPILNRHFERMQIPVCNNSKVAEICNDKAKTYQYLLQYGIPMPDTIFCKNSHLPEKISKLSEEKSYVVKSVCGHGGSQVYLRKSSEDDEMILQGIGSDDAVIQELIGKQHKDLRVYVIGKKIIGAVLREAKEGFRSNYSLGGKVSPYALSEAETALVSRIQSVFEFDYVGIDFLIAEDGSLIFNEIEDVVGAKMFYQCYNEDIVAHYLSYLEHKLN